MKTVTMKTRQRLREIDCSQHHEDLDKYVLCRYNKLIKYYWRSGRSDCLLGFRRI